MERNGCVGGGRQGDHCLFWDWTFLSNLWLPWSLHSSSQQGWGAQRAGVALPWRMRAVVRESKLSYGPSLCWAPCSMHFMHHLMATVWNTNCFPWFKRWRNVVIVNLRVTLLVGGPRMGFEPRSIHPLQSWEHCPMLPFILISMCQALWLWSDFWAIMSECLSSVPLTEPHVL